MNYNFIAPYYHSLSQLIFLNRQHQAHFLVLKHLKNDDKILWVGGGAGKLITELEKLNLKLEIDYVDFSSKMIELAKKETVSNLEINFIVADIFDYKTDEKYDVVITSFLFDHFNQTKAEELFFQLNSYLKTKGLWFYVDFVENQKTWQKGITNLMLRFFRVVIKLDIDQLPKLRALFFDDYKLIEQKNYFKKYIVSCVFEKK
ncbi:class I SAM-dependent methyltransferase [Empedobacter sedimenti]|uniref:class I SAM-dependent methyltransferase n=1 Tax=Empedobacter sedimenti TaxID=3042610 RepID=UPI0024A6CABE|nr:class I SAM-dependent methyltransferase [Empedobacter sedimenti]